MLLRVATCVCVPLRVGADVRVSLCVAGAVLVPLRVGAEVRVTVRVGDDVCEALVDGVGECVGVLLDVMDAVPERDAGAVGVALVEPMTSDVSDISRTTSAAVAPLQPVATGHAGSSHSTSPPLVSLPHTEKVGTIPAASAPLMPSRY